LTLTELRYIVAVAREKHFGKAAELCFVSQPTLSVSIKKLEDELSAKIFERGGTEVTLTDVGQRLVKQAQLILDESNKMKVIADQGRDPLLGSLKLGIIFTIGPYLLPRIVKTIIDSVPKMPLILFEDYTLALIEKLRTGIIDLAILAEPFDTSGLNISPIYDEPFLVAIPKKNSLGKTEEVEASDLKDETMLLLGVGHCLRNQALDVCPEAARYSTNAVGIQKTFEGSSLETIRHMVSSGLGITILPKMASISSINDDGIKLLNFKKPIPSRRVVLAWRKSFSRTEAIKKIKKLILSVDLPGCSKL